MSTPSCQVFDATSRKIFFLTIKTKEAEGGVFQQALTEYCFRRSTRLIRSSSFSLTSFICHTDYDAHPAHLNDFVDYDATKRKMHQHEPCIRVIFHHPVAYKGLGKPDGSVLHQLVRLKMNAVILRDWKETDFEPFAEMNSDPEVMRYLAPVTRSESLDTFDRIREEISQRGWGVWAVEVDGIFAGMVGLHVPEWHRPFSPCTEVLWRLRKEFWGRGIAHTAAREAIDYGFSKADLEEIVSFTTPTNVRSIRLMERLGFKRDHQGDFDHPEVPAGNDLRRHILYRKKKPNKARMGNPH